MGVRGGAARSSADRTASGLLDGKSTAKKKLTVVKTVTIRKAPFLVESKKTTYSFQ